MGPAYVPVLLRILWEAHCPNGRARFCLYEYVVFTTEFGSEQAVGSCGKECLGKSNDLINCKCGCPIKINSTLMDGFNFIETRDRLNSFAEERAVTRSFLQWVQCALDVPSHLEITVCRTFFHLVQKAILNFQKQMVLMPVQLCHLRFFLFSNLCFPTADSEVNCLSSSHQQWVVLLPSQHAKDHVCSIIHSRCINVAFLSALLL